MDQVVLWILSALAFHDTDLGCIRVLWGWGEVALQLFGSHNMILPHFTNQEKYREGSPGPPPLGPETDSEGRVTLPSQGFQHYLGSAFAPCTPGSTLGSVHWVNAALLDPSSLSVWSTVYNCWKWIPQMWDSCLYLAVKCPCDAGSLWQRHCSLQGIHLKDFLNQAQMSTFNSHFSMKTLLSEGVGFFTKGKCGRMCKPACTTLEGPELELGARTRETLLASRSNLKRPWNW